MLSSNSDNTNSKMDETSIIEASKEILSLLRSDLTVDINKLKLRVSARHGLAKIPTNSFLMGLDGAEHFRNLLQLKRVRSISGVNIIAVMAAPYPCPHGRCSFCPVEAGVSWSYGSKEPLAMRAIQNSFDPYAQVKSRLSQLTAIGHPVSKVELIVTGGTFPSTPEAYQTYFMKRCLDALNGRDSATLEDAKIYAESTAVRNVGITVETRPDWAKEPHIDRMLRLGVTRIEIGVQTLDDAIYRNMRRGHTVEDVIDSFRIAKDAGLKIVAHMMPGLPGSDPEKDFLDFRQLFTNPDFKPDMVKIYPCLVLKNTEIYGWWLKGIYKPYDNEQAVDLLTRIKEIVPPWIRIMRVQREFPADEIVAGVTKGNLRELALRKLKAEGKRCHCIRCREVGHKMLKEHVYPTEISLVKIEMASSEGTDLFISFEDVKNDILVGYVRLRIPSKKSWRKEIGETPSSIVRELHVYGPIVPVGERNNLAWQHRGFGSTLMALVERISRDDFDAHKILVTSALGTRAYYYKLGYRRNGPYMSKSLRSESAEAATVEPPLA